MKMHVLSGGRLGMKQHIFLPDSDRDAEIDLPVSCFLFRHPQGNVLFDTGCHPDIAGEPEHRWGKLARAMVPVMDTDDHVVAGLGQIGLAPDDIDVVVNSHFHTDHCGCNAFFSKAAFMVHAAELERAPGLEGQGYFRDDWDHALPTDVLEGERDLFGDGRLVALPLPGHTPGLVGLLAGLERSGEFLLASDAVSIGANLSGEAVPKNTWNADLLLKSLTEIRRIGARGATVVCGHDLEQWNRLKKGADAYD